MTLVFYDGVCGLCNGLVQFLLVRDKAGRLRFATLQGDLARQYLTARGFDPGDLNTVYVVANWQSPGERVLARSRAVLYAAAQLGPGWRFLAALGCVIPPPLADVVYRFVATQRYRVFGRYDACPLPRPEWRERFLD